jgi:L-ascorbate metabolism protein UlaG (beta-lactamase superfamily)
MKFIFFALLVSTSAFAQLEGRWLGVGGVKISDGKTTLLFDPVITKPSLSHWLFNDELVPDRTMITARLKLWDATRTQAVFISHTHFDHASDAGPVAELTGATVYGGPSLKTVVAHQAPRVPFSLVSNQETVQVGDFRVTFFKRRHAPIIQWADWHFHEGDIPKDFKGKFWQFCGGETWSYFVEHPQGNTLVDQGSRFVEEFRPLAGKVKNYFMGVANKKSLESMLKENFGILRPTNVFPVHFDFFFLQSETMEKWVMPGMHLEELREAVKKQYPGTRFEVPVRDAPIAL